MPPVHASCLSLPTIAMNIKKLRNRSRARGSLVRGIAITEELYDLVLVCVHSFAGTSVEQIERFYARNLPLSREMAKNLRRFGKR
jgi:hypothetical protein